MKYIDAEPLLKEINHIEEEARKVRISGTDKEAIGADGKIKLCLKLKSLIDSLQQEQPDFPTTDEEVEKFLATHPKVEVPDKYKTPDWLFKKQEQQEVDFEIGKYMTTNLLKKRNQSTGIFHLTQKDYATIARHFYELGKNSK